MLLEPPPPYQSFQNHPAPSHLDLPHAVLMDPRWIEVLLGHLKELDSFIEAKKKLGSRNSGRSEKDEDSGAPKGKGKPQKQKEKETGEASGGSGA